jgi:hypothetical protein
MTSLFNQTEHLVDICRPRIEDIHSIGLRLECYNPLWSVDSSIDDLVSDEFT